MTLVFLFALAVVGFAYAGYPLALMGRAGPALAARWWPIRRCTAFFSLNYAAAMALVDFLREPPAHLWHPTPDRIPAP